MSSFLRVLRQQRSHPSQKRRLESDLADVATGHLQHFVEGLIVPIAEELRVSMIMEPIDGMAYDVSFGEDHIRHVFREEK